MSAQWQSCAGQAEQELVCRYNQIPSLSAMTRGAAFCSPSVPCPMFTCFQAPRCVLWTLNKCRGWELKVVLGVLAAVNRWHGDAGVCLIKSCPGLDAGVWPGEFGVLGEAAAAPVSPEIHRSASGCAASLWCSALTPAATNYCCTCNVSEKSCRKQECWVGVQHLCSRAIAPWQGLT